MMTSCSLPVFAAAFLLSVLPAAQASTLAPEPSQKPSPAQPQSQNQTQTQTQIQTQIQAQTTPIFSLGTISIAPSSPQCSAGPSLSGSAAGKPRPTRPHHPARSSRHVAEPVPLRTYSRA